jgi:AraC-like DNA-binding protein
MQKAFPQVYRPDPITPLFEGALALPDIAEEVRTSLTSLQSQFDAEHDVARTALVESYRVSEPREPRRRTEIARQRAAGATVRMGDAPEVEQAKAAREELYEKYRKLLSETLTEEQLQAVPGLSKFTEPDPAQVRAAQQAAELQGGGKNRKPGLGAPVADDAPTSIEKTEPGKPEGGASGGLQTSPDGAGGSPKKKGG